MKFRLKPSKADRIALLAGNTERAQVFDAAYVEHACGRKKRYDDLGTALKMASVYKQKPYQCSVCGGYHLTTVTLTAVERYVAMSNTMTEAIKSGRRDTDPSYVQRLQNKLIKAWKALSESEKNEADEIIEQRHAPKLQVSFILKNDVY